MTIDKFLSFWSQHNTVIIEGLVALIILLSLYVAYRGFFGKKESGGSSAELGGGLDAVQLEKTLQKILENQNVTGGGKARAASVDLGVDVDLDSMDKGEGGSGEASAELTAEVAQLKQALAESRKKAETLQGKVKEAEEKAAQAAAAGGGAPAEAGMSAQEKEDLSGKIRDLEARLAEYEIISEDIADLSRYREENEELRKELDNVKAGAAAAPAAPAAPAPQPAAPPPPEPAPEVPVAEAAPAEPSVGADLIDDELMKEFAAAVEGQQNKTLEKAAQKAGDGTAEAQDNGDDASKLMDEFENFVAKKS
ncbi:hypothetical protein [Bdellovibrio sp. HCB2-146]|uniref:hypothetical protein n=1 Tax=Bdellovibrio sp. HCB2-146 TaxID=3394362 RepID=UPI0039BC75B1